MKFHQQVAKEFRSHLGTTFTNTRESANYVVTLDAEEQSMLKMIRQWISNENSNKNTPMKLRLVVRGRKPVKYDTTQYDRAGNIVGGIKNASKLDLYVYPVSYYY